MSDMRSLANMFGPAEDVTADCPKHGAYPATATEFKGRRIISECPACKDARAVQEQREQQAAHEREKAEGRLRAVAAKLATAGIPARFQTCGFDNFKIDAGAPHAAQQQRAVAICRSYAKRWADVRASGAVLLLIGGTGTGKTHLACAVANAIIPEHLPAVTFGTVSEYLRGIRDTYRKDSGRSEQQAVRALLEPDMLIMDEVGGRASEHDQSLMFDIINARYADMRPMILLSNLARCELDELLGARMADRLREVGTYVNMDWPSYRGRKGAT